MTNNPANIKHIPYARPAPGINPWLIRLPILFVTGIILLGLVLATMIAIFQVFYADKIMPGVYIYDIDFGGMSREEAIETLSNQFTYDEAVAFTFEGDGRLWQITAGELGVSLDTKATIQQSLASADGNLLKSTINQAQTWFGGKSITPIIRYDQGMATARLVEIANDINRTPQDAALTITGTTVTTTQGQAGRALDVTATLAQLDNAIMQLSAGTEIQLVIYEIPPLIWNVDEAVNQVNAALSGPLELVADGLNGEQLGPWTITVEQIAALLIVDIVDNNGLPNYQVSINMDVFESYLNELAPGLIAAPRDGRFHFNHSTQQLDIIQPAINGRELNVTETIARMEQSVFRYDSRRISIAFNYTEPRFHNNISAAELGIVELVTESTTYYAGSAANRRHNIAEGASRFDGIIIGPGEEFSFNYWLGAIDEENGFLEGLVIVGGRTVDGVGGGICQVSTTVFRAALVGGYTVIERNTHAYRVGYYELYGSPPGMDAAIWTPERDFRFQNDTPYHLLIETSIYPTNSAIQFRFYSTDTGVNVELKDPIIRNVVEALPTVYEANSDLSPGQELQVDWAALGADVTIVRIIRDSNGNEIKRDEFYTHYFPWQAVIQVASNDPRLLTSDNE